MCLKFGFVIFWQKDFGAKAVHKMLVKLTPGGILDLALVLQQKNLNAQSSFILCQWFQS
jgi:hypothetical protein